MNKKGKNFYTKAFRASVVEELKDSISNGLSLSNAVKKLKKDTRLSGIPFATIMTWYYRGVSHSERRQLINKARKAAAEVDRALGLDSSLSTEKSTTKEETAIKTSQSLFGKILEFFRGLV